MLCLPASPQWTDAWGTHWEKMWLWDPLKIHVFPITLNSENLSFAKNITMAFVHLFLGLFDSFLPSALWRLWEPWFQHVSMYIQLGQSNEWFCNSEETSVSLLLHQCPWGALGLWVWSPLGESRKVAVSAESHLPLLTDWESELRFLSTQFRGREVQKPRGYFNLRCPCLFLPPS